MIVINNLTHMKNIIPITLIIVVLLIAFKIIDTDMIMWIFNFVITPIANFISQFLLTPLANALAKIN